MRKSKTVKIETLKIVSKLQELEKMAKESEEEEKFLLERTEKTISGIAESEGLFCGVILTPKDLTAIIELMIESKESVKIAFKLYFKDNE